MLSPSDRAIVARDPALPGLALLLEDGALAARLGSALATGYLRYKPGTSCTVGLIGPGRTLGEAFAAIAYPRDRYGEVRRRPDWQDAATFLDDLAIAVIPAHLDRGLKSVRRIGTPARRAKLLRRLTGRHDHAPPDEPEVLRYKPGRRLVLRLTAGGRPLAALKTTGAGDFVQSLLGATTGAALGAAPLLGASLEHRLHVTGWIVGRPLCPVQSGGLPEMDALAETGAALARLHAVPPLEPFRITRKDEMRALEDIVADLATLDPGLAAEAGRLLPRIAAALGPDATPRFLHGDFSADQVILRGDGPVIIDYDAAAAGDPARDIGSFLARLDAQAVDGIIPAEAAEAAREAFMNGYAEAAGLVPDPAAQHARALLMLATEGFRSRHPDWQERTEALLARAATLIAPRQVHSTVDPEMPQLAAALDARHVLPGLTAALGVEPGTMVRCDARLVRHKPGRRALIRYAVEAADASGATLLGKLRAKGPDRHTPRVHAALRASGLDGSECVGVPAPRGRIDDLHLWLQDAVPGEPLAAFLVPGGDPAPVARTGAALARLHSAPLASDRRWTLTDEADVLDAALRRAADRMPDAAGTLAAIARNARARLAALAPVPACGIHRDFYFDQILVDGARIWLVDLDLYACGDPAIDIGNFLAHLDELGLRLHGDPCALSPQAEAFLTGYASVARLPQTTRIEILRTVSLARHVFLSTGFPDRRHTTRALLARAEADFTEPADLESRPDDPRPRRRAGFIRRPASPLPLRATASRADGFRQETRNDTASPEFSSHATGAALAAGASIARAEIVSCAQGKRTEPFK
jgi:aminoglycoside phosphotransferase (APT) family kinase protein